MKLFLALASFVLIALALGSCGGDGDDHADAGARVTARPSTRSDPATGEVASSELCELLTAAEASRVLATDTTAEATDFDGCHYVSAGADIRLTASPLEAEEYERFMAEWGAVSVQTDATGPLLCYDAAGLVFDAWFTTGDARMQLALAPTGLARETVLGLIEAVRS